MRKYALRLLRAFRVIWSTFFLSVFIHEGGTVFGFSCPRLAHKSILRYGSIEDTIQTRHFRFCGWLKIEKDLKRLIVRPLTSFGSIGSVSLKFVATKINMAIGARFWLMRYWIVLVCSWTSETSCRHSNDEDILLPLAAMLKIWWMKNMFLKFQTHLQLFFVYSKQYLHAYRISTPFNFETQLAV